MGIPKPLVRNFQGFFNEAKDEIKQEGNPMGFFGWFWSILTAIVVTSGLIFVFNKANDWADGDADGKAKRGCKCNLCCCVGAVILMFTGIGLSFGFVYFTTQWFSPGGFRWDKIRPEYCTMDKIYGPEDSTWVSAAGRAAACAAIVRSRGTTAWNKTIMHGYNSTVDLAHSLGGTISENAAYTASGGFSALVSPEWVVSKLIVLPKYLLWLPITSVFQGNLKAELLESCGGPIGVDSTTLRDLQE